MSHTIIIMERELACLLLKGLMTDDRIPRGHGVAIEFCWKPEEEKGFRAWAKVTLEQADTDHT